MDIEYVFVFVSKTSIWLFSNVEMISSGVRPE